MFFFDWLFLSLFNTIRHLLNITSIITYLSLTSRLLFHSLIFPSHLCLNYLFYLKHHFIWFILTKRYQLLWLLLCLHLFQFFNAFYLLLNNTLITSFDFLISFLSFHFCSLSLIPFAFLRISCIERRLFIRLIIMMHMLWCRNPSRLMTAKTMIMIILSYCSCTCYRIAWSSLHICN